MSFLGSILGGSGSQSQTQNINSTTSGTSDSSSHGTVGTSYDPAFQAATSGLISGAVNNAGTNYNPYGGMVVAPINGTQEDAFWGVKNNPNLSSPYMGGGYNAFTQAATYNPYAAAQPFLDQGTSFLNRAAAMPNANEAAQPYARMASDSFTGSNVGRYMSPYLEDALGANNRIANQNLTTNVMPAVNSQFIGSGGGARAGNNAYSNSMNGVLNNWENNLFNSNGLTTNAAYATAGNNFQADQNRYAGLAGTMGGLANNAMGAYGNLAGTAFGGAGTAASAASAAQNNFTNLGTSMTNAGNTVNNVGLSNDAALLGVGNQLQGMQQKAADYGVGQYQAAQQWPFQTSKYLADILQSTRVPTTVTSDNTGHTSSNSNTTGTVTGGGSSGSQPSILGSVLGGLTGLKGLGVFGGSGTGAGPLDSLFTATMGSPFMKRGGHFSQERARKYARGGYLGLDTPSSPPFNTNAGYWSARPLNTIYRPDGGVAAYYNQGGKVGHFSTGGETGGIGKILGGLLGTLAGSYFLPGVGGGLGGMAGSALGSLLPFDEGGRVPARGHFKYAAGGAAPVIKATRSATDKFTAAARAKAKRPAPGLTRQLALPAASGYFR